MILAERNARVMAEANVAVVKAEAANAQADLRRDRRCVLSAPCIGSDIGQLKELSPCVCPAAQHSAAVIAP